MLTQSARINRSTNSYFGITDAAQTGLEPGANQDFSISMWFKIDNGADNGGNLYFFNKEVSSDDGYWARITDDGISFFMQGSSGGRDTSNTISSLKDDEWHLIKCAREGSAKVIYLDGIEVSRVTAAFLTGDTNTTSDFLVGSRLGAASLAFDGLVSSLVMEVEGVVVLDVSFDGNSNDSSGNGNNLTPINSPTYVNDAPVIGNTPVADNSLFFGTGL